MLGQVFGSWTVTEDAGKNIHSQKLWVVQCSCGTTRKLTGSALRLGQSKQCRACKGKNARATVEGMQFENFIVGKATGAVSNTGSIIYECKCCCGATFVKSASKLLEGVVKSCGCKEHKREVKTQKGETGLGVAISSYKIAAKKRGLDWELTKAQTKALFTSNCYYCGSVPTTTQIGSGGAAREWGLFVRGGIDRVDNTKGYTAENSVACCTVCNYAKKGMSKEEFLAWVKRLAAHQACS